MIKKSVLPVAIGVIVILTGYFAVQLSSSPAYWCMPYFTFYCDVVAQVACGGSDYFADSMGSWCNGTTCRTAYDLYCETIGGQLRPHSVLYCDDEGGCDGEH